MLLLAALSELKFLDGEFSAIAHTNFVSMINISDFFRNFENYYAVVLTKTN